MDTRKDQDRDFAPGAMLPTTAIPDIVNMDTVVGIPVPEGGKKQKPSSPFQDSLRRLRQDKRAMISLSVILLFILIALVGPPIYQHIGGPYVSNISTVTYGPQDYHNYYHEELDRQHEGPSGQYWLGTDQLGRDIFARLMEGVLVSLFVAILVEVLDIVLGVSIGVLAGYYGGWIDQLLARFTDLMFAFPGLLLIILISGILGTSADQVFSHIPIIGANGNSRLLLVGLALAVTAWPLMARYVRGQTLQLKEQQFVEAARTSGTRDLRIIARHIVPNLFSIVVIAATLDISVTIVNEAGISLLGLGVQPPGSSIGLMISDASQYINTSPLEVLIPCIALAILVLAFSFLGDGLRDAFDPRSKD